MKKLRNDPARYQDEVMRGFALSHRKLLYLPEGTRFMQRRNRKEKGKVKLVMGNGGGHEPAWIGFVGPGLLDLDALGDVFTAQSGKVFYEAIASVYEDSPVMLIVSNHEGDVINGRMALALCEDDDMDVCMALYYDDIASASKGHENERRGMAGQLISNKVTGAYAEEGASLDECMRVWNKSRDNTRTLVMTLTSCTHPITGEYLIQTPEDEVGIGAGVHGESGSGAAKFDTSKVLIKTVIDQLLEDKPFVPGEELLVVINGMGSTTAGELSVAAGDAQDYLEAKGFRVYDMAVGNFVTTQEVSGISISLCTLDDELKRLWDAPCMSAAFSRP